MTEPHRGYLTLATGPRPYLEMAVDMTLSLREHTALPVALVADEDAARAARTDFADVFEPIVLLPKRFRGGRTRKYGVAEASPFEETIYLDADAFVLGALDGLFEVLGREPVVMVGERLGPDDDRNHHGFSTRALMGTFGLDAYLKTNSGLFAFRRPEAVPFMEECLRVFRRELRPRHRWRRLGRGWLGDEIGFGVVGGRRGVAVFPEPGPMFWPDDLRTLDLERPGRPFLHLLRSIPVPVFRRLLEGAAERRARRGLPACDHELVHREMDHLRRDRKLGRVRRLLGFRG